MSPRNGHLPAWAAEVVSSNIVGYNKVNLTPGYNMLSPMFTYVGGGDKAIVDLFEEKDGFVAADTETDADYISIWANGGYAYTYFFSSDAGDAWSNADDGFDETTDLIPEKVGFWFYNRGTAKTVTLAGEVPTNDVSVALLPGYNMIANPFSAPILVKSIIATEGDFTSADTETDADYISIWRNGGYNATYFFSSDAGDAWSSADDGFDETEETIGAGEAFWFYNRGSSSITIKIPAPYSL